MEDKWRHWIAKCLVMGHPVGFIIRNLEEKGYSQSIIEAEVKTAQQHPYIKGAKEVFSRELKKQDDQQFHLDKTINNQAWLLGCYEKLARLDSGFGTIERIPAPPFKRFVKDYISKNRPVILTGAMENWKPYNKWSLDYFRQTHGEDIIGIQDGRESDPYFEQNQKFYRKEVRFSDFLDRLEATTSSNDFYMTAGNMDSHKGVLATIFQDAEEINIRNEYFKFPATGSLWIGPKGTITPLHIDMINNFFCQIVGRKRVRLVPSWNMPWVYNEYHVYSDVDLLNIDLEKFPEFGNATVYDFVVEPGEVLFIPVGWWHHLVSLDITISLTRKNLNLPTKNAFGSGFIQESRNFKPGLAE